MKMRQVGQSWYGAHMSKASTREAGTIASLGLVGQAALPNQRALDPKERIVSQSKEDGF